MHACINSIESHPSIDVSGGEGEGEGEETKERRLRDMGRVIAQTDFRDQSHSSQSSAQLPLSLSLSHSLQSTQALHQIINFPPWLATLTRILKSKEAFRYFFFLFSACPLIIKKKNKSV